MTDIDVWWIHALVILIAAISLRPLYSWAQQFTDRLFYRKRYDYLVALENFMQETHDVSDLDNLLSSIVKHIQPVMQSASVHLLLFSGTHDSYVERSSYVSDEQRIMLSKHNAIVRWIVDNKYPLYIKQVTVIPQLQYLTLEEKTIIEKMDVDLFIPILTRGKEVLGLMVLGKKLSEMEYSKEEERFIITAANRIAGIIENAYLFDSERNLAERLRKQDEQKTEFLHNVAHELKTPLTSIIASSEILDEEQVPSDEFRKRLVTNIKNSADSMDKRVSELLDLARIQAGNLELKKETVDTKEFLSNIALQLHSIFSEKSQTLKLEIADSLPKINADKNRLEQIVFNLLTNASKFSPISGNVILRAKEDNGQLIVEVEDSAPAISQEDKERIFEPYYRGEDSNKRERFPGLGLGLSIAKHLVGLHQGKIWLESKAIKGNNFTFSLPVLDQN
ncbi:ATP-binding protein [Chloroflexota bacterium]